MPLRSISAPSRSWVVRSTEASEGLRHREASLSLSLSLSLPSSPAMTRTANAGMIGTIGQQQGIRMRKFCLAVLFGAVIAPGPAYAARCGGDFQGFVQNISAEAGAAGVSQSVIASALS